MTEHESFENLLFESTQRLRKMRAGDIVDGRVEDIGPNHVIVNANLKSEAIIPKEQFKNENGEFDVNIGDELKFAVEVVDDGYGVTHLSREKARKAEAWIILEEAYTKGEIVIGMVNGRVKGGFTVDIGAIRAFLPGSLADVRPVRDPAHLEGKELEFKIIKMDSKRNNVVVSRRLVVETESSEERKALLDGLEEGQVIDGVVKNLTDYGAFVDLGGIDGLLHITDMSWKRVKHPSEIVNVGDEVSVKVLKYDREKARVSLGLKQLGQDPWIDLTQRYPENSTLKGVVTNLTDYGCFVEIEDGIEGLVHVSEMDWTNKNIHPNKVVQLGDEIEVKVLEIDEDRRRISLGVKQCKVNPWQEFAEQHNEGEKLQGSIKSITDFGIFIGLSGNIDGLIHLSDIAWNVPGEKAIRDYKKGQEIEAVILAIDPERERISLGIKQLSEDGFANFVDTQERGAIVTGTITEVLEKEVTVDLGNDIVGHIRLSELSAEKITNAQEHFNVGDKVDARYMGIDKKTRIVNLSIKAVSEPYQEEKPRVAAEPPKTATLGDIFKEHLDSKSGEE